MSDSQQMVLITGAARGIGFAIAKAFAATGSKVVLADLPSSAVERSAEVLAAEGYSAVAEHVSVIDRDSVSALSQRILSTYGPLNVLVNNAGVCRTAPIDEPDSAQIWDQTIAVNLGGVFNMSHALLPHLSETRGSIVNVSSVTAIASGMSHVSYTASKGGVSALTRVMAREFASRGVRVNAIAPGWVDTDMGGKGNEADDTMVSWHCPMKRYGSAAEIAAPVVFLASASASFITGVTLPVDGGYLTV